jgi:hypothetical protein
MNDKYLLMMHNPDKLEKMDRSMPLFDIKNRLKSMYYEINWE